jgi:hypothetical protein
MYRQLPFFRKLSKKDKDNEKFTDQELNTPYQDEFDHDFDYSCNNPMLMRKIDFKF